VNKGFKSISIFSISLWAALILVLLLSPAAMGASSMTVSDNTDSGLLVVQNDVYKAVFGYKATAQNSYNRSGGNLVGLYYKSTDPLSSNNLVNVANYGDGRSTLMAGVGGTGMTHLYASDTLPGSTSTNRFADLIGDNNESGILSSKSVAYNADGSVSINFVFRVRNQNTGVEWYQVEKTWTADRNGRIGYVLKLSFLRSGYISEPTTVFKWDRRGGWTRFEKFGHDWLSAPSTGYMVSILGLDRADGLTWDSLNRFHPDLVRVAGSTKAPDITVESVGGFDALGSYQLGRSLFGSPANPTMEQSAYTNSSSTGYAMAWFSWWGGNPPVGSRYHFVNQGTSYTDSYSISLASMPSQLGGIPKISNVAVTGITKDGATLTWNTDIPSPSAVKYGVPNGSERTVSDASLVTNHSIHISGLNGSTSYNYRVVSGASTAVDGDGIIRTSVSRRNFNLQLSASDTKWSTYSDYQSRILTVSYTVVNSGADDAASLEITGDSSTSGVYTQNLPQAVGALAAGNSATFKVRYQVPVGVSIFNSSLTGMITDVDGDEYSYPD